MRKSYPWALIPGNGTGLAQINSLTALVAAETMLDFS